MGWRVLRALAKLRSDLVLMYIPYYLLCVHAGDFGRLWRACVRACCRVGGRLAGWLAGWPIDLRAAAWERRVRFSTYLG